MLVPLLILGTALVLLQRSRGSTVGAGGPPGTIVDVNPIMGERHATVSAGQTVRVNLPHEWFLLKDVGTDPDAQPLQAGTRLRGEGGLSFVAASPGRQTLTFFKAGSLENIVVTIDVMASGHGYGTGFRYVARPYREFWGRFRQTDPYWRWRETQWRMHRHWEPAWGPQPPIPADPVVDVVEPPNDPVS
jgi:hypothetical protein